MKFLLCIYFILNICMPQVLADTSLADIPCYSVSVNGEIIPVEVFFDISYVQFFFEGNAGVTVTFKEGISGFDISPHRFNISGTVNENSLSFNLDKPKNLIITINNSEKLFIFAENYPSGIPDIFSDGVINIMDTGAENQGVNVQTELIQSAIDEASKIKGGGVLYFPSGIYKTGSLKVGSNVTIYLEKGAVLLASDDISDFPNSRILDSGTKIWANALIVFDNAENSGIAGHGTIDGNGTYFRTEFDLKQRVILIVKSKNIEVKDVILRNPAAWNSHFLLSENIRYDNVKIINNIDLLTSDGIDPDSSSNVHISNIFSYSSDDGIAVKTSNSYFKEDVPKASFDITVENSIFWTKKTALKVGTETLCDISSIRFINNEIVHADRAMAIYLKDGGNVQNIEFTGNAAEFIGGDANESIFVFDNSKRADTSLTGNAKNILIKDFEAEGFSKNNAVISGLDYEHLISDVVFDNYKVNGILCENLADARITLGRYVNNVKFKVNGLVKQRKVYENESFTFYEGASDAQVPPDKWSMNGFSADFSYAVKSAETQDRYLNLVSDKSSNLLQIEKGFYIEENINADTIISLRVRVDNSNIKRYISAYLSSNTATGKYIRLVHFDTDGKLKYHNGTTSGGKYSENTWYDIIIKLNFENSQTTASVSVGNIETHSFVIADPLGTLGGIRFMQQGSDLKKGEFNIDDLCVYQYPVYNEIELVPFDNNNLKAVVKLREEAVNEKLLVTLFENNILKKIFISSAIDSDRLQINQIIQSDELEGCTLKAFLWNGFDTISPLTDAVFVERWSFD